MRKLFNILILLLFSLSLSAQQPYTSLYYSDRLLEKKSSFHPILLGQVPQNSLLGLNVSPIASYTYAFGESTFNCHSFGFGVSYKTKNRFRFTFDSEKFTGKQSAYSENYLDEFHIFPGRGELQQKADKYTFEDFNYRVGYNVSKYFDVEIGQHKHFIGDGYRSLLLSDNSSNYPFLRFTTSFWKVKYTNLYTTFTDIWDYPIKRKKHATFHYLDLQLVENISIGIFESVIWQSSDEHYYRGFDYNYWNPIIFYRPVEFSQHSPDNVLMGANFKCSYRQYNIYGQLVLDDLNISRQKDRDENYSGGFFQNKFAYQIGLKSKEPFDLENLFILGEYNQVQPYTYAHKSPMQNYTHMNQALAHPLGANFKEMVGIINYSYQKWNLEFKWNRAIYGADSTGTHFGKNIFLSDFEAERDGEQYSYGNFIGQGVKTIQDYISVTLSYQAIKNSNLYLYGQITSRKLNSDLQELNQLDYMFGIKTNLYNSYFDF